MPYLMGYVLHLVIEGALPPWSTMLFMVELCYWSKFSTNLECFQGGLDV